MAKIKHIVYTADLADLSILEEYSCEKISVLDARSAVYVATGIAAQNKDIVLVFVNSNNSSRSAFSGMTEAFYRNLPVVLVTLGQELNYSKELNDVVNSHFVVASVCELDRLLDFEMPMHIEISTEKINIKPKQSTLFELLKIILGNQTYLYVGQNIAFIEEGFQCKIVRGGTPNCLEGSLANVLGASLAKKRNRYIGVVMEDEFIHDINTLGNININDSILYIVLCTKENRVILEYASSLGFQCYQYENSNVTREILAKVINNGKKTLIMICGE